MPELPFADPDIRRAEPSRLDSVDVRAGGLEPPQCLHQQDLNLPRMPFRHARAAPAEGASNSLALRLCGATSIAGPAGGPAAGDQARPSFFFRPATCPVAFTL